MRVLELYSGIGGMHYALRESGVGGDIIAAIDINNVANEVYKHNFPNVSLINRNVQSISVQEVINWNVDTILMSPPCQPYTRVGHQKHALDSRASSLFYVLDLIPKIKTLKYILLENVKGFETSETRDMLLKCMNDCGFNYKELILSPCQFNVPNTRYRYYLLAKKKDLKFCLDYIIHGFDLPEAALLILPKSKHNVLAENSGMEDPRTGRKCYTLDNILEKIEGIQYMIPKKVLQKRAWVLDIRTAQSNGSCCFTKAYAHYMEGTGSVFCPYSMEVVKEKYVEASKHERYSIEASEILSDLMLRYFTPREVSRLMCFPEDFTFPVQTTIKQKYRLLGNSINVHVVSRLIFLLHTEQRVV